MSWNDDYDYYEEKLPPLPDDDDDEICGTTFTPTEFIAVCNQTLEYAYENTIIEGEVASFKVNQGKWVFFDLKDEESSVSCFMTLWDMRMPLEDGMKVKVRGYPKLTKWGKFSFTVKQVVPVGEGSLKKSFELLKKKLEKEGLFDSMHKRPIPDDLSKIGVISSTQAAGYADFIKIINARWGGLDIQVAHTQVQGMAAADQIIRALKYFNEKSEVEIIAILRGGGSADDLSVFNDEELVRAIAASRIPVITGIGHEIDESLADLAADIRASTPSNAAEMLTEDRRAKIENLRLQISHLELFIIDRINSSIFEAKNQINSAKNAIALKIDGAINDIHSQIQLIERLNPEKVLLQGYSLVTGKLKVGNVVKITTAKQIADAEIKQIKERK